MRMYFSINNNNMRKFFLFATLLFLYLLSTAQSKDNYILLKPDRVFDGENFHEGWVVLVKNNIIEQAGAMNFKLPAGSQVIELKELYAGKKS